MQQTSIYQHEEFDNHELVHFCFDRETDLRAIVALHDTTLGPAFGGIRMFDYTSESEALKDVLRLSKGMTYKNALAGMNNGGGKAVILGSPEVSNKRQLLRAFAMEVSKLGGQYIVAEDAGVYLEDLQHIGKFTPHVRSSPLDSNGDPTPFTAWGVFKSIETAVQFQFKQELNGCRVMVDGIGSVGMRLCQHLYDAGVKLLVSDIKQERVDEAQERFKADAIDPGQGHLAPADVYSPCAMGGILNEHTIPVMQANIVAGAANNQLATPCDAERLKRKGITYCPDFVVNAGGVRSVPMVSETFDSDVAMARVSDIAVTLEELLKLSQQDEITTNEAAEQLATRIIQMRRENSPVDS